jgi:AraC-like DNA-binding protein
MEQTRLTQCWDAPISGISRSALAARFKSVVGKTPLEYLTGWRIYQATRMIQKRGAALADVSRSVGYESAAAFNRVFKEETGRTPGAFRKAIASELEIA